ncbi:hypothetical protein, partial [Pseudomonas quasicaspiana]|uniref:hypothetical protein n=1 Tax=Pseudomonas quasicaspiana TaxID=2829821 RepID=UPI001E527715
MTQEFIVVTFRVLILFIVDLAGMAVLELLIEIPFFKYILWEQSLLAINGGAGGRIGPGPANRGQGGGIRKKKKKKEV